MTDRELLELAAKAAGYRYLTEWKDQIRDYDSDHFGGPALHAQGTGGECRSWNPLTNDGDALRLAVKLGMDLLFTTDDIEVVATQHDSQQDQAIVNPWAWESWRITQQDPYTATRRAIVRAAAEIVRPQNQ